MITKYQFFHLLCVLGQSVSFECNIDYDAILKPILEAANKTLSIQSNFSRNLEDQDKTVDDLKINVERLPDVIGQIIDPIIHASNQGIFYTIYKLRQLQMNYYAWKMRALRPRCFSSQMNNQHPWQLKKSKSWWPFWSYQLISTANSAKLAHFRGKLAVLSSLKLQNAPQVTNLHFSWNSLSPKGPKKLTY